MSQAPSTVQQWVESLPTTHSTPPSQTTLSSAQPPIRQTRRFLPREISLQSDDASSHCSSLESVLDLRKPDPEAVLLGLGFGPPKDSSMIDRIPPRFLKPSKVLKHIDINKFLEQYDDSLYSERSAPSSPATPRSKYY